MHDRILQNRLRSRRNEKKLSQLQLAKLVNTTKGTISNYENGYSTPNNEMLVKLANSLDVSVDYLLGRVDNPHATENELEKALAAIPDLSQTDPSQVPVELFLEVLKIKKPTIDGRPIPEEKKALIIAQLEATLEILRKQQNGGSKDE